MNLIHAIAFHPGSLQLSLDTSESHPPLKAQGCLPGPGGQTAWGALSAGGAQGVAVLFLFLLDGFRDCLLEDNLSGPRMLPLEWLNPIVFVLLLLGRCLSFFHDSTSCAF